MLQCLRVMYFPGLGLHLHTCSSSATVEASILQYNYALKRPERRALINTATEANICPPRDEMLPPLSSAGLLARGSFMIAGIALQQNMLPPLSKLSKLCPVGYGCPAVPRPCCRPVSQGVSE